MDPPPKEEKTMDLGGPKDDITSRVGPANTKRSSGCSQLKAHTLTDCMSVMSAWNDATPSDSDTDSDASDMSFTDDELRGTSFVMPNTNMSNSGKEGKSGSASSVDISAAHNPVSGSGSDFFNNPVATTASDNFNAASSHSRVGSNNSSEDAIQKKSSGDVSASRRTSILTRIKRSLKKNPKFVNANAKLIEMTPGKLRFRQNDRNTYDPLEVCIRNISDSIVAYKLKRSDGIFEVSRRMGILNPLEVHTVIVSVKASGKVNNNRIITRVAVLQEGQLTEPNQQVKFWKQLPAREIRQLVKLKCVPLAPGDALNDGTSDFSDADTMSMMTTGSCISSNTSMLSASDIHSLGNSPQVSPCPSGKAKPVDVPLKDTIELPRHDIEMTITKSLEQIKTEIFGKPSDIPAKPKDKPTKVFEKKQQEQVKQSGKNDDPKADAASEPKDNTAAKPTYDTDTKNKQANRDDSTAGKTNTIKQQQEKEPHLSYDNDPDVPPPDTPTNEKQTEEAKDTALSSKHDELTGGGTATKPSFQDDSSKSLPQEGEGAKGKVKGGDGTRDKVTDGKNTKGLVADEESAKGLVEGGEGAKCKVADGECAKGPVADAENATILVTGAEGTKGKVENGDGAKGMAQDRNAVHAQEPPNKQPEPMGPSDKETKNCASNLPNAQQRPSVQSEEPREGSMGSKEIPQQAQISAFHATEFEGPAAEIPGLMDSQAYKKQANSRSPRRYQKPTNDTEMKYESEPKLSMQEHYADLHKLKQSFSESPMADYNYGTPLDMKPQPNQRGFTPPKSEPFQTDESELEYEPNVSNKPSIHIYRSAWSHSPTIPNQKFIKRETSSRDLTKEYPHGIESGLDGSSPPKLHRHAPFYDFVMSHNRKSPGSDHWHNPRVSTPPQMYCPGHQYKVNTSSPLTIHEGSNSSLENGHSVEFNEGEPQTITVTTHISTSSLQDARSTSRLGGGGGVPRKKSGEYFGCSDDADSEEADVVHWKLSRFRRNKQKIANLTQNVITGLVFLFMWSMLLMASMLNSYGSGLCWEAPPEPEPYSYEWLTDYLFEPAREV